MKHILYLLSLLLPTIIWSQEKVRSTDQIIISGQIKREYKLDLADLARFTSNKIPDLVITNHLGQTKGTAKQLAGVSIKDIFRNIELNEENPRRLSEFYFTFIASDNYKVVFSWNEIFNSPTGQNIYIITSKDGKNIQEMDDRILLVTTSDLNTGRRYIKGLSQILVKRVE